MHFIFFAMHTFFFFFFLTLPCVTLARLIDPHSDAGPVSCWPHLGPGAGVWLSAAIGAPRDWWQLFTDEAVFIIPVQGCTDQMDPDHPSTVRDTSVPVVAQSTNKSPAPWKAVVSHRGMDTDSDCLLKNKPGWTAHSSTRCFSSGTSQGPLHSFRNAPATRDAAAFFFFFLEQRFI